MKKLFLCLCACLCASCAPKVYVLDHQTILQTESTGEFPDLSNRLESRAKQFGPKMADRSRLKQKEVPQRAYTILNGELTSETAKK